MKEEFYKKFANEFLKKDVEGYVNYIFKDENGNIRLEIYTSTKREYEERVVFIFGKDFCEFKNDYIEFDLSEEWKKYLLEETRKKNALKEKPKNDFREFCEKVNGDRFFGLKMPTYKLEGQEISTFEFFKRELEKMCGCKLSYIRYTSPFTVKENTYENYDTFTEIKSIEYEFLMPECLFGVFCKNKESLSKQEFGQLKYEELLKNNEWVFVLNASYVSEREEAWNFNLYKRVFYLHFDTSGNSLLFNDIYKKDKKYDEIILKTLNYHAKSVNKSLDLVNLDKIKEN